MRKLFILILILIFSELCLAQQFGVSFGITAKSYVPFDMYFVNSNGLGFKVNCGLDISKGQKGEDYTETINWDAFPEDHVSEGSYYTTIDFGVGKYFEKVYFLGLVGVAKQTLYRNCFDSYHILGDNGDYYKRAKGINELNYGVEVGYFKNNFIFGLHYTKFTGIGLKIGFYLGS